MVKLIWILPLIIASFVNASLLIRSDTLERDEEGNIIARGRVEVFYGNYFIMADEIIYKKDKKVIIAKGNVFIEAKDENLIALGDEAKFDIASKIGYIREVSGKYRRFYFKANDFKKVGEEIYETQRGEITTCPPDRKEALLCFSRARITDRYIFSFNNVLKIGKVPVFYLPIGILPVGDRRSGFLEPMIGTDTYNRVIYRQPLYWAISEDKDATITFDYRSEQADGIELEYRQVLSSYSKYSVNLFYYREPPLPGLWWKGRDMKEYRRDRYRFKMDGNYGGLRFGVDTVSDAYFMEDIYFVREKETVPYLLSYIDYHREFKDVIFTFNLKKFRDLTLSDSGSIDKLPEIGIFLKNREIGKGIFFNTEIYYTNFFQEKGEKTHRFIMRSEFNKGFNIFGIRDYISFTHINNYYLPYGDSSYESDNLITTFAFENRIPFLFSLEGDVLKKQALFEVVYTYQPDTFENPQFDVFDEINRKSEIKFRMSADTYLGERQILGLFMEGGYNYLGSYFLPTDGKLIEKKLLPLRVALNFSPVKGIIYTQDFYYDHNLRNIIRLANNLSLTYGGASVGVGSYISRNSQNKTVSDQTRLRLGVNYKGYFINTYSNIDNRIERDLFKRISLGYKSPCWSFSIKYRSTWDGNKRDYINEIYLYFSVFNIREFILPLRTR